MADQLTEATERLERLLVEALGSRHEAVTDWAAVKFALRDAARFRWLAERMLAADFDWQDSGECVLVFRYPVWGSVSADARKTIDSGIRNEHPPSETTDGVTTCRVDEIPLTDEQRKLLTVMRDVSIPGAAPERQPLDVDLPERVIDQLVAESGFTYIEPEEHHVYSLAQAIKREVLARIPNSALARGVTEVDRG